jgi:hypothetical protein
MASDQQQDRPAIGQPAGDPTDTSTVGAPDIAGEHEDTAVDKRITAGRDGGDRETESPDGWAGMDDNAG